jgi:hypothetical protein
MINNPNYPLRSLAVFILPLLTAIFLMRIVPVANEKALPPFNSLVVAFEFVNSAEDVISSLEVLTPEEVTALDRVNYYDFFFMAVYSLFLGMFINKLGLGIANQPLKNTAWVAIVVFGSDLLENIMMLKITSLYAGGGSSFSPYTNFLPVFTWAKWGLLAVIFAGLGIVLIQRGTMSKVLSLLLFLPAILLGFSVIDFFSWINRFTTSIFLGFVILLIFAVCFKKPEQNQWQSD